MNVTTKICGVAFALWFSLAGNLKADDLYVTGFWGFTIGDYTTGGGTINSTLVSGLSNPWALRRRATTYLW